MQRWEYQVVALQGGYTDALNELGADGWELVSVAAEPLAPAPPKKGAAFPVPRALGKLEQAADRLTKVTAADSADAPGAAATSRLLWVFRRPLSDDG